MFQFLFQRVSQSNVLLSNNAPVLLHATLECLVALLLCCNSP
jgi:hypothetical protein